MANMSLKKNPMPSQEPDVRNKNFDEVALGYTEEMAIDEAKRCLNCKNKPCVSGCPVGIPIPEFVGKVAEGDLAAALTGEDGTRDSLEPATLALSTDQLARDYPRHATSLFNLVKNAEEAMRGLKKAE